ncbi:MFS transporter, partial [Streptomyces sp. NPDC086010]|uniref:MFS transporter n=1 Tax=Streptomyces sp. NPDC086010 TaxID=3365745 RepID=UPI0037D5B319
RPWTHWRWPYGDAVTGRGPGRPDPSLRSRRGIAAAQGVAASAQWIANWAITASFPLLAEWNLSGTYVIYTIFAALSIPFVLKFMQKTKGKALEEMS